MSASSSSRQMLSRAFGARRARARQLNNNSNTTSSTTKSISRSTSHTPFFTTTSETNNHILLQSTHPLSTQPPRIHHGGHGRRQQCCFSTNTRIIKERPQRQRQSFSTSSSSSSSQKLLQRDTYSQTTLELNDSHSLFPEAYTSAEFGKAEFEQVFKQAWVCVGHTSSVLNDGDVLSMSVSDSVPILITNHKGTLHAFYNVCRHRGSQLLKPGKYTKCNAIRCPYHSWTYSCNGTLVRTPYFNDDQMPSNKTQRTGDAALTNELAEFQKMDTFDKRDYSLFDIPVRTFFGCVFVNLNPRLRQHRSTDDDSNAAEAELDALWRHQFGDLEALYRHYPSEDFRVVFDMDFEIGANWKCVAENFIEYYHLPWVHPELCEVSSVANHVRRQGTGQYCAFSTYPLTAGDTPADPGVFPDFRDLHAVDRASAHFVHIFPNLSLWIFPHHVVSLINFPRAPGTNPQVTREKMYVLFDKSLADMYFYAKKAQEKKKETETETETETDPTTKPSESGSEGGVAMEIDGEMVEKMDTLQRFWKMVNLQDVMAVENVQRGLQCSDVYRGGRFSPKFEEPLHRFENILIDYMTNEYMKEYPGDGDEHMW